MYLSRKRINCFSFAFLPHKSFVQRKEAIGPQTSIYRKIKTNINVNNPAKKFSVSSKYFLINSPKKLPKEDAPTKTTAGLKILVNLFFSYSVLSKNSTFIKFNSSIVNCNFSIFVENVLYLQSSHFIFLVSKNIFFTSLIDSSKFIFLPQQYFMQKKLSLFVPHTFRQIKSYLFFKLYLESSFFFRALPSLRSGRAFQPSLTLILPLHFIPLQNFGLPCPNA